MPKINTHNKLLLFAVLLLFGCMIGRNLATAVTFSFGKKPRPRAIVQTQIQHCKEIIKKQIDGVHAEVHAQIAYVSPADGSLPSGAFSRAVSLDVPTLAISPLSPRAPPRLS